MRFLKLLLMVAMALTWISCSGEKLSSVEKNEDKKKSKHEETANAAPAANTSSDSAECDQALWDRVYDPPRLEVLSQCKVATGTIVEQDENEDGDTHMLLKLDPGQDYLLAKRNLSKKDGNLVIEVVCAHPTKKKKVDKTCADYANPVPIPKVNDHVRVTGTYVNDTHNGWTELHPVSKIEKQ